LRFDHIKALDSLSIFITTDDGSARFTIKRVDEEEKPQKGVFSF
jgi:hypothetical protein